MASKDSEEIARLRQQLEDHAAGDGGKSFARLASKVVNLEIQQAVMGRDYQHISDAQDKLTATLEKFLKEYVQDRRVRDRSAGATRVMVVILTTAMTTVASVISSLLTIALLGSATP